VGRRRDANYGEGSSREHARSPRASWAARPSSSGGSPDPRVELKKQGLLALTFRAPATTTASGRRPAEPRRTEGHGAGQARGMHREARRGDERDGCGCRTPSARRSSKCSGRAPRSTSSTGIAPERSLRAPRGVDRHRQLEDGRPSAASALLIAERASRRRHASPRAPERPGERRKVGVREVRSPRAPRRRLLEPLDRP